MPSAMRYAIVGLLCAALAGMFLQPWYIVVIAFSGGAVLGLIGGFLLSEAANLYDLWQK